MATPSKSWWQLLKQTASEWSEDKAPRLGAALAYYTALSISPLAILSLRIASTVFGDEAARGEIERQARHMVGDDGARAIQAMVESANQPGKGTVAAIVGIATLLFGASGVFGQLQDSLNTIWEVQPKPGRGIVGFLKDRVFSFTMVMGCAFLLLVSLAVTTILTAATNYASQWTGGLPFVAGALNTVVSLVVITLIFALLFKVVPDAEISWRDVWIGAALTAILFTIGKFALGQYLVRSSIASSYGVAGSLIVLLVWVYYTSQIVFFGAEFTQVYANQHGRRIEPSPNAMPVTQAQRDQQGMPAA